jgi:hypothetical protein
MIPSKETAYIYARLAHVNTEAVAMEVKAEKEARATMYANILRANVDHYARMALPLIL